MTDEPGGTGVAVPKRLLTVKHAAEVLSISRSKLYELIADSDLDTVHIGRSVRIPVESVDEFVSRLRHHPAA